MKLSLAFSPCPNDTFMFDAMVHQKIDTEGLEFDVHLMDVEALNLMALENKFHITKLSFNAFLHVYKFYSLLSSGAAIGEKCGPLLIVKQGKTDKLNPNSIIAIPGKYTTANSLFNLAFPNYNKTKEMLFSDIEKAVVTDEVDAGVIIHENRFTYQDKGLEKVLDLGEYWESKTRLPIPLGGIFVSRSLNHLVQQKVQRVMRKSIEYAFKNPRESEAYIVANAQEMDLEVMKNHIKLYVNDYSINLGDKGKKAVQYLFESAAVKIDGSLFV